MLRPTTSNVAALSGIVANGHQAIHFVSSAPSKIPYGGFSPVRLQTRLTPRPPSRACQRPLIGRHCRYLRPRCLIRSRTRVQAAPRASDPGGGSSGPWLPVRLYCPVGSSLTMATSAPLSATQWLMDYSIRLRVRPASRRGSPIYSASPFAPCRRPYSGGSRKCRRQCLPCGYKPSPSLHRLGNHFASRFGSSEVCVTKLQRLLNATARERCLPRSDQGFYDRAFVNRVTPKVHVGYVWMAHCHLPSPDFHRLDWQPYGLQAKPQRGKDQQIRGRLELSSPSNGPWETSVAPSSPFRLCGLASWREVFTASLAQSAMVAVSAPGRRRAIPG